MKLKSAGCLLLMVASPAIAHDFWIQPVRFQIAAGASLPITFQVGHGKFRERWSNNRRIILLADFVDGKRTDRRGDLRQGPADMVSTFSSPGMHILGVQTNPAFSELPASRFNDYAREEGLVSILAARRRDGSGNRPGRERYSRRAKALIQVGPQSQANGAFATRPVGFKLEIVPDRNPYALDGSRMLPLHVLYNGRRLPNATVKLTNLGTDERPFATAVTDRAGRVRFRIPTTGQWLVNVVWGERVRGSASHDYETTFSSMTFGFPAGRSRS